MTKINKLSDADLVDIGLPEKGYSCDELVGQVVTVTGFEVLTGDSGEYLKITIDGDERHWSTGAQAIVAKLKAVKAQGLLPVTVEIQKFGRAFDIK